MASDDAPFSRRHGYRSPEPEITVREDAPKWLRKWLLHAARDHGIAPSELLKITRRLLPEPGMQVNAPNIEVFAALESCEWYGVYDVAEAVYAALNDDPHEWDQAVEYEERLNKVFRERGVGWQMVDGRIEFRGSEPFEAATREAKNTLAEHGRPTAAREVHEALRDLSRRPEPDLSGAVTHAMAALECVAREVSGESGATLGKLISQRADDLGIRPPLDKALDKLWGYASEQGRHLREGREPGHEEAELVVGVAASVSVYLSKRSEVAARAPAR